MTEISIDVMAEDFCCPPVTHSPFQLIPTAQLSNRGHTERVRATPGSRFNAGQAQRFSQNTRFLHFFDVKGEWTPAKWNCHHDYLGNSPEVLHQSITSSDRHVETLQALVSSAFNCPPGKKKRERERKKEVQRSHSLPWSITALSPQRLDEPPPCITRVEDKAVAGGSEPVCTSKVPAAHQGCVSPPVTRPGFPVSSMSCVVSCERSLRVRCASH